MHVLPRKALLPCLVSAWALACGGSSPDTPSSPPPSSSAAPAPKLVWNQFALNADELRRYSYVLYVDGAAAPLSGAACGTIAAETLVAACSAPLPTLTPGPRTLELATRVTENGVVLESAKSAPITYSAGGSVTLSVTLGGRADTPVGPDASRERPFAVEAVVTGLDRPTALANLPDGRLLIAEQGGAIRISRRGGALGSEPAGQLPGADPAVDAAVSLALAPDFDVSRRVYAGYGARNAEGVRTGRVVRFREAGGVLGESAVILDGLPAAVADPWVTIGRDGSLYVATSAADGDEAADVGSYAGKILRLGLDGSTPPGNPLAASPVYSFGYRNVAGIDWEGRAGTLWVLETDGDAAVLARAHAGRPGARVLALGPIGPARMAFLPASAVGAPAGWRGSLFVAAPGQHCLLRVAGLSGSPAAPAVEQIFKGEFGAISLVLAAPDGLYFATGNGSGADGQPADAVYRVSEHANRIRR